MQAKGKKENNYKCYVGIAISTREKKVGNWEVSSKAVYLYI